ncbi:hypothetical protein PH586_09120 [Pseudomonas sp. SA3-5]|uniref:Uncharacterized protein n=1 Tax=Pseudomonas aestuarii TaxID=3018340 RepID=A0ABT4XE88_9PSED|nr:hypothetical protein [Pseudomonas aestuarii]MDA7086538.1 hypothetical protein [Pseudomonas aestuarii]
MPVEILARYATNTYVARAKGHKGTASCTESARAAAAALARKLGLDPALLQEQQNDLVSPNKVMVFSHPGEVA